MRPERKPGKKDVSMHRKPTTLQRKAALMSMILSEAFRIRIPPLFFNRGVRAPTRHCRTNGNRLNSLKIIGVATRHASLNPPPKPRRKLPQMSPNVVRRQRIFTHGFLLGYKWNRHLEGSASDVFGAGKMPGSAYARRMLAADSANYLICNVGDPTDRTLEPVAGGVGE
jgi:hypothetical protein